MKSVLIVPLSCLLALVVVTLTGIGLASVADKVRDANKPLPPASAKPTPAQVVLASACVVEVPAGLGSGVVVSVNDRPHILTAAHVVDGLLAGIIVRTKVGDEVVSRPARVVRTDANIDLALLDPDFTMGLVPVKFPDPGEMPPPPGVECWYCGSGHRVPFCLVKSIVNQDDGEHLLVNGEGWFGHSGSGVLVEGKLVGVIVAGVHGGPKAPVLCVPWRTVKRFLNGR